MDAPPARPLLARISNEPREYAWGSTTAIARYLGRTPSGNPEAELWFGAHPGWPARVDDGTTLEDVLDSRGLPQPAFLLKVLAADVPLSLQVHPSTEQAIAGFDRENAEAIPIDAASRSYKDARAKPELIVAVTPFAALAGFRRSADIVRDLEALVAIDSRVTPLIDHAADSPRAALTWLLSRSADVADVVAGVTEAATSVAHDRPLLADTVARVAALYPGDPGVAVTLLLHRLDLAPGEALHLAAGHVHAYLGGLGIELMEASDNVLRAGLTPKHVDAEELLRIVEPESIDEPRLAPVAADGATIYTFDELELRHVHAEHRVSRPGPAIVLAVTSADVEAVGERLHLAAGEAAYVSDAGALQVTAADAWVAGGDTPKPRMNP